MTTSGTVGITRIDTATLVNKAVRRCGINPSEQTAELVSTALEDLFMLILSLANKGINLWCVEKILLPLIAGQTRYVLPLGTEQILNVVHSTPTLVTGTETVGATSYVVEYTDLVSINRIGMRLGTSSDQLVISISDDGVTWTTVDPFIYPPVPSILVANTLYWFDLEKTYTGKFLKLENVGVLPAALVVDDLYVCSQSREIAMAPFNRDDYANQPNKTFQSRTLTNYYFEKLIEPAINFWPAPNTEENCVVVYRQRQIQDVGDLQNEIEIPSRWYEAITWHLALRLAFEVPGVDPGRIAAIQKMTQDMTMEVELGETDDAPIYFSPRIGVYTR